MQAAACMVLYMQKNTEIKGNNLRPWADPIVQAGIISLQSPPNLPSKQWFDKALSLGVQDVL
jgi:hypothetical protein